MFVTRLALEYRMRFRKDVVIDLVCYRRHGHNEADEPSATQPVMYSVIRKHPTVRQLYAEKLGAEAALPENDASAMVESYRQGLDEGRPQARASLGMIGNKYTVDWSKYSQNDWSERIQTGVEPERLKALGERIIDVPPDMTLQARVAQVYANRKKMLAGDLPLDWGCAETLAYASLLEDGFSVRLVGQDAGRGTFFHRHSVLHDQKMGQTYIPLQHIKERQPAFQVIDSVLSEEAVMGFEYGYSTTYPDALVIWEGQFGDFANGAQVIIDQFISSGEAKWGRLCGLTLFLPHGYEGQGPEHSSARLERFLQLCAEMNMQVCVPSTPAQMFHMIRRQMLRSIRKPLIVMTPKSLLRHELSVSSLEDLSREHVRDGHRRAGRPAGRAGASSRVLQRQGLLRPAEGASQVEHPRCRARPHRTALSVPDGRVRGGAEEVLERPRARVVPGRAAESGRLVQHSPSLAGNVDRSSRCAVRRSRTCRGTGYRPVEAA